MKLNSYAIYAIQKEIERLEEAKREFPNDEWLYEPDLTELKQQLEEAK